MADQQNQSTETDMGVYREVNKIHREWKRYDRPISEANWSKVAVRVFVTCFFLQMFSKFYFDFFLPSGRETIFEELLCIIFFRKKKNHLASCHKQSQSSQPKN